MNKVYLLLGSNMGNSEQQLKSAAQHIESQVGNITRFSSLYQTAAWGNTKQPDFLNQVLIVQTKLEPEELLTANLQIEQKMGRIRTVKNAPRIIDIDILYYNKLVLNTANLKIPHPEIPNRRFVLIPLNELSPLWKHPLLLKNNHQLLQNCKDELNVKKF